MRLYGVVKDVAAGSLFVFAVSTTGSMAAPIPFVEARAILSSPGFAEGLGTGTDSDINQTDGSASAFRNHIGGASTPPGVAGEASASAGWGVLRARGEAIDPPGSPAWNTSATGQALYRDVFTFLGGVNGTPGTAQINLLVSGFGLASHDGGSDAGARMVRIRKDPSNFYGVMEELENDLEGNPGLFNISLSTSELISTTLDFVYGQPFELEVFLQATAATTTGQPIPGQEEHSIMDFSETLLTAFILQDSDTMSAQSGTQYQIGPFLVASAPAALGLFSFGLAVLAAMGAGRRPAT